MKMARGRGRGTARGGRATRSSGPAATQAQDQATPPPTKQKGKKPSVAQNAADIAGIFGKLGEITTLLVSAKDIFRGQEQEEKQQANTTPTHTHTGTRHVSGPAGQVTDYNMQVNSRGASGSNVYINDNVNNHNSSQARKRHATTVETPRFESADLEFVDGLGPDGSRTGPECVADLEDDDDLQHRVTKMLMANLATAPKNNKGKAMYAYNHIFRGDKKVKAEMGELSIAEYNYGFKKMVAEKGSQPRDKVRMLNHLHEVNQDAMTYDWRNVRTWSEGVCKSIEDKDYGWKDQYTIDRERQRVSQKGNADGVAQTNSTTSYKLSPEVEKAMESPPCRQYNMGSCSFSGDHVMNGYRHLHICSTCIYRRCTFEKHPECTCSIKQQADRRKEERAGFGNYPNQHRNQQSQNNSK